MKAELQPYRAGKSALDAVTIYLATDDALVELDGCLCDFVVRRRDGRVMLRQRRGEFAQGRRLAVTGIAPGGAMPRLDIATPLTAAAVGAPDPQRGSWQEKLKLGFMAGLTQATGTMFTFGMQHDTAESILGGIAEHWADLSRGDLVGESADAAVATAHLALRHFIGTFYQVSRRLFDPWLNRCLASSSFLPENLDCRALAAESGRPFDPALFQRELCAYAVQEHIGAHAEEGRLLKLAARVAEKTAPFLNGLIQFAVISSVSAEPVMQQKTLEGRITALRAEVVKKLDGPAELGMLPDAASLVGPMFADIGGMLFTAFAPPQMLEAVKRRPKQRALSPELLLAAWFDRVGESLAV